MDIEEQLRMHFKCTKCNNDTAEPRQSQHQVQVYQSSLISSTTGLSQSLAAIAGIPKCIIPTS